jgi:hypothetical protein
MSIKGGLNILVKTILKEQHKNNAKGLSKPFQT